jgi:L-histidine Nalpha-methyltransferase
MMKTTAKQQTNSRQWPMRSGSSRDFAEYIAGLKCTPKRLPSKFFYDAEGSRLFEKICKLDEYYLTRAEVQILKERGPEIADLVGERVAVVELGSGSDRKIRLLLEELEQPVAYVPVEISEEQLRESSEAVQQDFPQVEAYPVCADYTNGLKLPALPPQVRRTLLFFPGSTLGNFEPIEALAFLQKLARLAGPGAALLIGVDLKKDPAVLEAAYNDREGVTAEFNLNILARANREFGADFDLSCFAHAAFWDGAHRRIVMQLESLCDQDVRVGAEQIHLASGERIITEYSYKYTQGEFAALARLSGFVPWKSWTDPEEKFSLHLLAVG